MIATVLFVGLALTWIRPAATCWLGLAAQAFALLGTFGGIFTIAIGIGPRTTPEIVYHIGMVIVLVSGLIFAVRARSAGQRT